MSLFFTNVGNLNKQKLIKGVQGIHVVSCVTPVLAIHADSLNYIRRFAPFAFHGIQEPETQTVMTEKILSALKLNETLRSILSKAQYVVVKFAVMARLNSHLVSLLNYPQEPWYMKNETLS